MKDRILGKTGWQVSEVGLGTWQLGGKWGQPFDDALADRIVDRAVEDGITFVDTADVYNDGQSERALARALKRYPGRFRVATKAGRQIQPHVSAGYTPEALRKFVDQSLGRLGCEALDLVQLHCPPTEVYYRPELFETAELLVREGKVRHWGVSVEKIEEGLKALDYPVVSTIQVIFNMFRLRPAELLFEQARRRDVGIIVRVPLASGLLTGTLSRESTFGADDHRNFNRNGAAFDKGETFSGVDYERGLAAVEALKAAFHDDFPLSSWALRWILMFDAVSTVIPGASKTEHVDANTAAASLPSLTIDQMDAVRTIYDTWIRQPVHYLW